MNNIYYLRIILKIKQVTTRKSLAFCINDFLQNLKQKPCSINTLRVLSPPFLRPIWTRSFFIV